MIYNILRAELGEQIDEIIVLYLRAELGEQIDEIRLCNGFAPALLAIGW